MASQNYQDLLAWQKALDRVEAVYAATRSWPREEIYGLTSQIRRAAVSVPSNIAEGQGRSSPKELLHHLRIAHGSLRELETQILIARRLDYIPGDPAEQVLTQAAEVGRLINGFSRYWATK